MLGGFEAWERLFLFVLGASLLILGEKDKVPTKWKVLLFLVWLLISSLVSSFGPIIPTQDSENFKLQYYQPQNTITQILGTRQR